MKLAKDLQLVYLANQVGNFIKVTDDTNGSQYETLKAMAIRRIPYHAVTRIGEYWVVRLTLSGHQITIGKFPDRSPLNAVRFADLAIVHFWKYRASCRAWDDEDLTLGSGFLAFPPDAALNLLKALEDHLKSIGLINEDGFGKTVETRDPRQKQRARIRAWGLFIRNCPPDTELREKIEQFEADVVLKLS